VKAYSLYTASAPEWRYDRVWLSQKVGGVYVNIPAVDLMKRIRPGYDFWLHGILCSVPPELDDQDDPQPTGLNISPDIGIRVVDEVRSRLVTEKAIPTHHISGRARNNRTNQVRQVTWYVPLDTLFQYSEVVTFQFFREVPSDTQPYYVDVVTVGRNIRHVRD
jgi:hypothetical protein